MTIRLFETAARKIVEKLQDAEPFLRLVLEAKTPTQLAEKRAELESILGVPVDH